MKDEKGSDPNAKNDLYNTPIMTACSRTSDLTDDGLIAFVSSMIEHGADINAVDNRGKNALEILIMSFRWGGHDDDLYDLLHVCYHFLDQKVDLRLGKIVRILGRDLVTLVTITIWPIFSKIQRFSEVPDGHFVRYFRLFKCKISIWGL